MERHKGNKTRVAEELGLTRVGLRMKLARLASTAGRRMKLLWLQSGGCGGCTLSWLGSEHGSAVPPAGRRGHRYPVASEPFRSLWMRRAN
jgi:hypothetical protein